MPSRKKSPTRPKRPRSPGLSRRRFFGLVAAGSATLAAGLLPPVASGAAPRRPRVTAAAAPPKRSAAIEKGIREQQEALDRQLKAIREYSLPAGSDMAFVFKPIVFKPMRSKRER